MRPSRRSWRSKPNTGKLYELEEFEEKVQGNSTGQANPEVQGLIWNISYGCSQVWFQKQMQEIIDQQTQIPIDPV